MTDLYIHISKYHREKLGRVNIKLLSNQKTIKQILWWKLLSIPIALLHCKKDGIDTVIPNGSMPNDNKNQGIIRLDMNLSFPLPLGSIDLIQWWRVYICVYVLDNWCSRNTQIQIQIKKKLNFNWCVSVASVVKHIHTYIYTPSLYQVNWTHSD